MPRDLDFTDVPDQKEWKPAPSGDYILELVDAEEGGAIKSGPNTGKPLDKLQFEIVDCEGELEEFNGRRIYENVTYGEKAMPRVKTMLKAFGVDTEDGPLSFDWDELLGKKLRAKVRSVGPRRDKNDPSKEYAAKNEITRYLVLKDEDEDEEK